MYFSTVPPWLSIALDARAKYSPRMRSTSSGSVASLIAVNETRSQKSVVTTLRSSAMGGGAASGVAQRGQNAKSSCASKPHEGQAITAAAL
jgi:hypothetical protein